MWQRFCVVSIVLCSDGYFTSSLASIYLQGHLHTTIVAIEKVSRQSQKNPGEEEDVGKAVLDNNCSVKIPSQKACCLTQWSTHRDCIIPLYLKGFGCTFHSLCNTLWIDLHERKQLLCSPDTHKSSREWIYVILLSTRVLSHTVCGWQLPHERAHWRRAAGVEKSFAAKEDGGRVS